MQILSGTSVSLPGSAMVVSLAAQSKAAAPGVLYSGSGRDLSTRLILAFIPLILTKPKFLYNEEVLV